MALLSALIVYGLVYHLHWQTSLTDKSWLAAGVEKVKELLSEETWQSWVGVLLVTATLPLLLLALFYSLDGFFGLIIQFLLAVVVLLMGIGGKTIGVKLAPYLKAAEHHDMEGAHLAFSEIEQSDDSREPDELVRHVTRYLLRDTLQSTFGVLFWFIILGPAAALFYRIVHWYHDLTSEADPHRPLLRTLVHWIDWLPARLTALLFLLTGDFVAGFYRLQDYLYDADADNQQLIADTGVAALGLKMGISDAQVEENKQCLGLIDRTLMLYLVLAALLTPFGLWP